MIVVGVHGVVVMYLIDGLVSRVGDVDVMHLFDGLMFVFVFVVMCLFGCLLYLVGVICLMCVFDIDAVSLVGCVLRVGRLLVHHSDALVVMCLGDVIVFGFGLNNVMVFVLMLGFGLNNVKGFVLMLGFVLILYRTTHPSD